MAEGLLGNGEFFTGLTRDDVGGIRFLLTEENLRNESLLPNTSPGTDSSSFLSPWIPFTSISNLLLNTNFNPGAGFSNIVGNISTNLTNLVTDALRPGVNKLNFIRSDYDSLIGINFIIVTNQYTDQFISNSVPLSQPIARAIAAPDFLFTSEDLGLIANLVPVLNRRWN